MSIQIICFNHYTHALATMGMSPSSRNTPRLLSGGSAVHDTLRIMRFDNCAFGVDCAKGLLFLRLFGRVGLGGVAAQIAHQARQGGNLSLIHI